MSVSYCTTEKCLKAVWSLNSGGSEFSVAQDSSGWFMVCSRHPKGQMTVPNSIGPYWKKNKIEHGTGDQHWDHWVLANAWMMTSSPWSVLEASPKAPGNHRSWPVPWSMRAAMLLETDLKNLLILKMTVERKRKTLPCLIEIHNKLLELGNRTE